MPTGLWWKAGALIVVGVVGATTLLSIRQERLQAAHELTRARLRILELDTRLLDVRRAIADRTTPDRVARGLLDDERSWRPAIGRGGPALVPVSDIAGAAGDQEDRDADPEAVE